MGQRVPHFSRLLREVGLLTFTVRKSVRKINQTNSDS